MVGRHARLQLGVVLAGAGLASGACRPQAFDELSQATGPLDGGNGGVWDGSAEPDAEPATDGQAEHDAAQESACGDTRSTPEHCGQCGYSCTDNFAVASCRDGRCARCDAQHADCNADLALGAAGDGCERRVDNDSWNCGGCDVRCIASRYGFAGCREGVCNEQTVQLTSVVAGIQLGGSGGVVFSPSQLCAPGDVLIGISGVGDTIAYGLGVHCGRVALSRTATGYAIRVLATTKAAVLGGSITPAPPRYTRLCGDNELVTAVHTTFWQWPGTTAFSLRQLTLTCSAVSVDDGLRLQLTTRPPLPAIGDADDPTAVSLQQPCEDGAVAGFTGRYGAYIDALAVHCGTLTVEEVAGTGTTSAE